MDSCELDSENCSRHTGYFGLLNASQYGSDLTVLDLMEWLEIPRTFQLNIVVYHRYFFCSNFASEFANNIFMLNLKCSETFLSKSVRNSWQTYPLRIPGLLWNHVIDAARTLRALFSSVRHDWCSAVQCDTTRETDTTRSDNEDTDINDNTDLTDIKWVGNGEQEFQVKR